MRRKSRGSRRGAACRKYKDTSKLVPTYSMKDKMFGLDTCVKLIDGRLVVPVNLDNGATTPPFKSVMKKITDELRCYGSIGRAKGQKPQHTTNVYTEGREIVKAYVDAASPEYTCIYVNNTTDGMNKLASALITSPDDLVLTTDMEHHANDLPWRNRGKTIYAGINAKGRLDLQSVENLLAAHEGKVKIVTVTAASNVTGYVNDIKTIAAMAHKYGAKMVVDGAQIVAHRAFSMKQTGADFIVFSAHKMYAPYGGGAIVGRLEYLNEALPHYFGGGMVDLVCRNSVKYLEAPDRYEAGSPNYPGVVGMLEAMRVLSNLGFDYIEAHEQRLLARAIAGLRQIPGVILYGDNDDFSDRVGTIVFNIEGVESSRLGQLLADWWGISVRHAMFCAHYYVRKLQGYPDCDCSSCQFPATGCTDPACSMPPYLGMVRASFGIYTDEKDIDYLIAAVRDIAANHDSGKYGDSGLVGSGPTAPGAPDDDRPFTQDRG